MNYSITTPSELLGHIKRAKRVESVDSLEERVVGFRCDGKLWGFRVSDETTRQFFRRPPVVLGEHRTTCQHCGETKITYTHHEVPLTPEVQRLKTQEGRKSLEKGSLAWPPSTSPTKSAVSFLTASKRGTGDSPTWRPWTS